MKLTQSSPQYLTQKGYNEISIYTGDVATGEQVRTEAKKLIAAFPDVTNDFIILLSDRLADNKFTAQRIKDAINFTIDTCKYKRPSIADIVSFDRKIDVFTYEEIQNKCAPGYPAFEYYEKINLNGKARWIAK